MKSVTCEVNHDNGVLRIKLIGEIDHHSARTVRDEIDKDLYFYRAKTVLMDLSGIEFMDSSGLGLILGRYTKTIELGGKLKVVNPSKAVMKILNLAGTDKIIAVEYEKEVSKT